MPNSIQSSVHVRFGGRTNDEKKCIFTENKVLNCKIVAVVVPTPSPSEFIDFLCGLNANAWAERVIGIRVERG